jgi:hypothetical protein
MQKLNSKQIKEKVQNFKKAYRENFGHEPDLEFVKQVMSRASERAKEKYIIGYLADFHGKSIIDINSHLHGVEVKDVKTVNSLSKNKQSTKDKSGKSGAPVQVNRASRKVPRKKSSKATKPKGKPSNP